MKISAKSVILVFALAWTFSGAFCLEKPARNPAQANSKAWIGKDWGIGLKAGTDGFGLEIVKGINARTNLRMGYSLLKIPISKDVNMQGISAHAAVVLKFGGFNLTVDFYPVKNWLHLSAGLMQNGMRHSVTITPLAEVPYGDILIPASEIGILKGEVMPGIKVSPYAGIGIGNTLSAKHIVSFNFEMGALYHSAPEVILTGTNLLSPIVSEVNRQTLMNAIAPYKWYPLISMQLNFRLH